MATRNEVKAFLDRFKTSVEFGYCQFHPRPRFEQDLIDLNLTRRQALNVILSLSVMNYSSGPTPDNTDESKDVWIFGCICEETEVYIKLRLIEAEPFDRGLIWSFHKAEYPLKYPLKEVCDE